MYYLYEYVNDDHCHSECVLPTGDEMMCSVYDIIS